MSKTKRIRYHFKEKFGISFVSLWFQNLLHKFRQIILPGLCFLHLSIGIIIKYSVVMRIEYESFLRLLKQDLLMTAVLIITVIYF